MSSKVSLLRERSVSSPAAQAGQEFVVIEAGFEFLHLLLQSPKARIMGMDHYAGLNVRDEGVCRDRKGGEEREEEEEDEDRCSKRKEEDAERNTDQHTCESLLVSDTTWGRREVSKQVETLREMLYGKDHMKLNPSFTQITNSNSRKTEMSSVKKKSTIQMSVRKYLLDPEWEKTKLHNIMIILT